MIKVYLVHSQECSSQNLPANIKELTGSWCSISWTVQTNTFVAHGCFLLRAEKNWSRSSLNLATVHYTVSWQLLTTIWNTHIEFHIASNCCCFQSEGWHFNVHPASYYQWLHWQWHDGLTDICVVAVCQWVTHWMKFPPIGLIKIRSHLAGSFQLPLFIGVKYARMMITKEVGSPEECIVRFKSERNK